VTRDAGAELAGVPLPVGQALLRGARTQLWWFARSMYLCAGSREALPELGFQPSGGPGRLPPAPALAAGAAEAAGGARAVFGFRCDAAMRAWAARHGAALAMPAPAVTARLGDKTYLPHLAKDAGVAVPRCVIRRAVSGGDAAPMWRELRRDRAVAQLAGNDLTGAGTRAIGSAAELATCLREWAGSDVKLAEYVTGVPLTASGVVTADSVVVSGISYQLVGYPALTPRWGAHCGNQLAGDGELPPGAGARCRQVCLRVGETLAKAGFRGMYGIDVIVTGTDVVVIELNPRVQSVTSLLNSAELAAGLLPSPLLHALSFVSGHPAPPAVAGGPLPRYGQMVVSSAVPGTVAALPGPGVYQLQPAGGPASGPAGRGPFPGGGAGDGLGGRGPSPAGGTGDGLAGGGPFPADCSGHGLRGRGRSPAGETGRELAGDGPSLAGESACGLAGEPVWCVPAGPAVPLASLRPGQALVWPMASAGERIGPADRLCVVQLAEPVVSCPDGTLTGRAAQWLAALSPATAIDERPTPVEGPSPRTTRLRGQDGRR
jgi:ATP-grasp domain-containing protein